MRSDAARNRERLMAAGRDVFARRGRDASLDEIAAVAGVGVGTAYRHFANKTELAEAIMSASIAEVAAAAGDALEVDDPWPALVGFLEAVLQIQATDRGLRQVIIGVHTPGRSEEAYRLLSQPIREILLRAQRSGDVRPGVQTSDLGCLLAMLCEVSDIGGDTAPALWRRYLPTVLAALRPDGPPLPGTPLTEAEFRHASELHQASRLPSAAR